MNEHQNVAADHTREPQTNRHAVMLNDLLKEYAEKLREKSDIWLRVSARKTYAILLLVAVLVGAWSVHRMTAIEASSSEAQIIGLVTSVIVGPCIILVSVVWWWRIAIRQRLLFEEISALANQLDRLIQNASQYEDHLKDDFTMKLRLDLSLGEAESARWFGKYILRGELRKRKESLKEWKSALPLGTRIIRSIVRLFQ